MEKAKLLLDKHLDYVDEMLNIGAGNAATALSLLLGCPVSMEKSEMKLLHASEVATFFGGPDAPVACLRMRLVGDLAGYMFFIVPHRQERELVRLAASAMKAAVERPEEENWVADALAEIGNILTGTYLGAIHDFCALNVYHSVPSPGVDMLQALLDEFLANQSSEVRTILLITVKFMISDEGFKTFLLICPSRESCSVLVNSISGAERTYGVPVD